MAFQCLQVINNISFILKVSIYSAGETQVGGGGHLPVI